MQWIWSYSMFWLQNLSMNAGLRRIVTRLTSRSQMGYKWTRKLDFCYLLSRHPQWMKYQNWIQVTLCEHLQINSLSTYCWKHAKIVKILFAASNKILQLGTNRWAGGRVSMCLVRRYQSEGGQADMSISHRPQWSHDHGAYVNISNGLS